jgi:putative selenate reductase FAD-binding subunit
MFTAGNYVKAASLEEAFALCQKRANRIVGGMQWMKMGKGHYDTLIDLSGLGLDRIREDAEGWEIGAMASLRSLEENASLREYTGGAMKEALRHIVGVQFRNLATVGGTVAGRYGFSDLLTLLSVLPTEVVLFKAGAVPLADFLKLPSGRDIVTGIRIRRAPLSCHYESVRLTETDLPILTCAASRAGDAFTIAVGARPQIAMTVREAAGDADTIARRAAEEIPVGSNLRGSAAYRRHLVRVLVRRSVLALAGDAGDRQKTKGEA